jgi:hypothetical protein
MRRSRIVFVLKQRILYSQLKAGTGLVFGKDWDFNLVSSKYNFSFLNHIYFTLHILFRIFSTTLQFNKLA